MVFRRTQPLFVNYEVFILVATGNEMECCVRYAPKKKNQHQGINRALNLCLFFMGYCSPFAYSKFSYAGTKLRDLIYLIMKFRLVVIVYVGEVFAELQLHS